MKILFVTNHLFGTDGYSRYTLDIVEELKARSIEVECVVWKKNPECDVVQHQILQRAGKYLVNVFVIFTGALKLKRIIKSVRPDVVHFSVEPYAHMLFFMGKKQRKPRYILTVHGTYSFIPNVLTGLKKYAAFMLSRSVFQKIEHIVAVSTYTKDALLTAAGSSLGDLISRKATVITNGVKMIQNPLRVQKDIESSFEISFVGVIRPRKGIAEALRALALFKERYTSAFVYNVIGDPIDQAHVTYLKHLANELGLEKNVVFHGRISGDELLARYARSDLFLMTSVAGGTSFEGFGLVYLEANAHGVPSIGPFNSGAREAILEGKTGFLIDPQDTAAVAERVKQVLIDKKIRSEDCISWAYENRVERKVDALVDVYSACAGTSK